MRSGKVSPGKLDERRDFRSWFDIVKGRLEPSVSFEWSREWGDHVAPSGGLQSVSAGSLQEDVQNCAKVFPILVQGTPAGGS